jgi:hypothetical protein
MPPLAADRVGWMHFRSKGERLNRALCMAKALSKREAFFQLQKRLIQKP